METERTDNTKNNKHEGSGESVQQSSGTSHVDLEHTSPTDSRADEKVIVNHRDVPGSFNSNSDNKKEA